MSAEMKMHDAAIIGGGLAGLSAALYLGRAMRDTLVIDNSRSMARWEPDVQNYLGFPDGISGSELINRARTQAQRYDVHFVEDEIVEASRTQAGQDAHSEPLFALRGSKSTYQGKKLLLATGIFHIPPDIEGVSEC